MDKRIKQLEKGIKDLQKQLEDIKSNALDENKGESEFEVGKWYKGEESNILAFCEESYNAGFNGYGFGDSGVWYNNQNWMNNTDFPIPATDKEVEQALIKEAKRRGFKEGVRFDCENSDAKNCLFSDFYNGDKLKWQFSPENNTLSKECNQFFFKEGKWAEIIENKLTINGDVVNIKGDTMTIGCKSMTTQMFIDFVGDLDFFDIHTIYGDKDKGYNIEDLKKICDELK